MQGIQGLRAMRAAAHASAGEALRKGALAIVTRLGLVIAIVLAVHVPLGIAAWLLFGTSFHLVGVVLFFPLLLLSGPLTAAALAEHTILGLGGDRAKFGKAFAHAFRGVIRALPIIVVASSIEALGYALFVVPGIIASVLFALAVPIVIVERASIGTALSRSISLSVGARWALFAAFSTASVLAGLMGRLCWVALGDYGFVVGFLFQSALASTTAAVLFVDRVAAHQGVEIESIVVRLGGVPGGAARLLDEDVERALAGVNSTSAPPMAMPISVKEGAVLDFAEARDRKMRRVIIGAVAAAAVVFVGLGGLGIASRISAAREAREADAARLVKLGRARADYLVVLESIRARKDIYGPRAGELAVAMNERKGENRPQVLAFVEDELGAIGCTDGVLVAKRASWGGGAAFARACPAAPLTADDAGSITAEHLAVATALEARAAKAGKSNDETHRAVIAALLRH